MSGFSTRLRAVADEVGETYGDADPPDGPLSLGDRAYFIMHEAASLLETLEGIVTR